MDKTNADCEGGIKQIWVEIKAILGKKRKRGRHGKCYLKSTER